MGADDDWLGESLCRNKPQVAEILDIKQAEVSANIWFPKRPSEAEDGDVTDHRMAQKVCGMCPVAEQCLQGALDRNETMGIWGGMTTNQRRRLKNRGVRVQQGTVVVVQVRRLASSDRCRVAHGARPPAVGGSRNPRGAPV